MNKHKQGFTIIEVVLVLGIAGVIFVMAFIALPSLWASQRDAARKANVMTLVSDLKTYQTNNSRGAFPDISGSSFTLQQARATTGNSTTWQVFVRDYVGKDFADPLANDNRSNMYFNIIKCTAAVGKVCRDGVLNSVNTTADPAYNKNSFTIYIVLKSTCDGDHAVGANGERSASIMQILERGGRYCHST